MTSKRKCIMIILITASFTVFNVGYLLNFFPVLFTKVGLIHVVMVSFLIILRSILPAKKDTNNKTGDVGKWAYAGMAGLFIWFASYLFILFR